MIAFCSSPIFRPSLNLIQSLSRLRHFMVRHPTILEQALAELANISSPEKSAIPYSFLFRFFIGTNTIPAGGCRTRGKVSLCQASGEPSVQSHLYPFVTDFSCSARG
jgi:hypothetical protein